MARVIHFEIPARDPERARAFYARVFDWEIRRWDGPQPYWLAATGSPGSPGIDGGIRPSEETGAFVNIIDVASIDEALDRVTSAGGKVVRPKDAVPGIGYTAYCRDPEGNLFGLMEEDMTAE